MGDIKNLSLTTQRTFPREHNIRTELKERERAKAASLGGSTSHLDKRPHNNGAQKPAEKGRCLTTQEGRPGGAWGAQEEKDLTLEMIGGGAERKRQAGRQTGRQKEMGLSHVGGGIDTRLRYEPITCM